MPAIDSRSRVAEVTVYSDRALVVREARLRLPRGESLVSFEPLPDSMDRDSVQLSGAGARLKDIAFKRVSYEEVPEAEKRALEKELQALDDRVRELEERKAQSQSERSFVERIAAKLTGPEGGKPGAHEFSPESWIKMVDFYRSRLESLDAQVRDRDLELRDLEQKRAVLQARMDAAGGQGSRQRNRVEVIVEAGEADPVEALLRLSYLVYGPSWCPAYDLRAQADKRLVSISYQAMVCQNSGEDWDGVSLRLSTAQPAVSGTIPELPSWRLAVWVPPPPPMAAPAPMMRAKSAKRMDSFDDAKETASGAAYGAEEESVPAESEPMAFEAAAVEGSGSQVVFLVPGSGSIPSDGEPHRVGVSIHEFPAEFSYTIVPKIYQRAYLAAKVKNASASPFLKGLSRIYLDNAFIAEASLGPVMPEEEFEASLGVDEAMKVEYRRTKKFDASAGLGGKRKRIEFEYKVLVTNKRKTEETLKIKDAFPVSGHQDIVVKEIEPDPKRYGEGLKRDDMGRFVLTLKAAPGQETAVTVAYTVEYPKELRITGL